MADQVKQHNYQAEIVRRIADGAVPLRQGTVHVVQVQHDRWCQLWQGGGCNCEPEILLRPATEVQA